MKCKEDLLEKSWLNYDMIQKKKYQLEALHFFYRNGRIRKNDEMLNICKYLLLIYVYSITETTNSRMVLTYMKENKICEYDCDYSNLNQVFDFFNLLTLPSDKLATARNMLISMLETESQYKATAYKYFLEDAIRHIC